VDSCWRFEVEERSAGACYARPVTIGDHVWIAGGVTINQGVTIGDNTIVGSGSVVTRSIPSCVAVGSPARVLREITGGRQDGLPASITSPWRAIRRRSEYLLASFGYGADRREADHKNDPW
jgi:carbonic anhydrase/acetyltransferase-like protein (isoleucine patch superfamily)